MPSLRRDDVLREVQAPALCRDSLEAGAGLCHTGSLACKQIDSEAAASLNRGAAAGPLRHHQRAITAGSSQNNTPNLVRHHSVACRLVLGIIFVSDIYKIAIKQSDEQKKHPQQCQSYRVDSQEGVVDDAAELEQPH